MHYQARTRAKTIPPELQPRVAALRRAGCTILDICREFGWSGTPAEIAGLTAFCDTLGRRYQRGIGPAFEFGCHGRNRRGTWA